MSTWTAGAENDRRLHKRFVIFLITIYKEIYLQNQPAQFNQLEGSNSKMFTYRLNSIKILGFNKSCQSSF